MLKCQESTSKDSLKDARNLLWIIGLSTYTYLRAILGKKDAIQKGGFTRQKSSFCKELNLVSLVDLDKVKTLGKQNQEKTSM